MVLDSSDMLQGRYSHLAYVLEPVLGGAADALPPVAEADVVVAGVAGGTSIHDGGGDGETGERRFGYCDVVVVVNVSSVLGMRSGRKRSRMKAIDELKSRLHFAGGSRCTHPITTHVKNHQMRHSRRSS
jgi:hypothetical protein